VVRSAGTWTRGAGDLTLTLAAASSDLLPGKEIDLACWMLLVRDVNRQHQYVIKF
jgi:hypothetical protein